MKLGPSTEAALDRAVHPLDLRGVLNAMAAMVVDGDYEEAHALSVQATGNIHAGPEHLFWSIFGAQRLLQSLLQGRRRRRRDRHAPT